jgi:hypothetical protein
MKAWLVVSDREPDKHREDSAVTAYRGGVPVGRSGGGGMGDIDLGEAVTIPPAGAPFLNEAVFCELGLVWDSRRFGGRGHGAIVSE